EVILFPRDRDTDPEHGPHEREDRRPPRESGDEAGEDDEHAEVYRVPGEPIRAARHQAGILDAVDPDPPRRPHRELRDEHEDRPGEHRPESEGRERSAPRVRRERRESVVPRRRAGEQRLREEDDRQDDRGPLDPRGASPVSDDRDPGAAVPDAVKERAQAGADDEEPEDAHDGDQTCGRHGLPIALNENESQYRRRYVTSAARPGAA